MTYVEQIARQTLDIINYVDAHKVPVRQFYLLAALAGDLKSHGWYTEDIVLFRSTLALAITDCSEPALAKSLLALHASFLSWERYIDRQTFCDCPLLHR